MFISSFYIQHPSGGPVSLSILAMEGFVVKCPREVGDIHGTVISQAVIPAETRYGVLRTPEGVYRAYDVKKLPSLERFAAIADATRETGVTPSELVSILLLEKL